MADAPDPRDIATDVRVAAETVARLAHDLETCRDLLQGLADLVAERSTSVSKRQKRPPLGAIVSLLRRYADRLSDGSRLLHDTAREIAESEAPT